jgi:hypothetical protein
MLKKSRRRDPSALDYGGFMLVDAKHNLVVRGATSWPYDLTLDDVAAYLTDPDGTPDSQKDVTVRIRRQFDDYRIGEVPFSKLWSFQWKRVSGGVQAPAPFPFVSPMVICTDIKGEIGHSGAHGPCPHEIRVCVNKSDQDPAVWAKILQAAGPKPR